MSTSAISICGTPRRHRWLALADYLELTKPRIAVLVLVTVAVAAFVARWGALDAAAARCTLSARPWWPPAPAP